MRYKNQKCFARPQINPIGRKAATGIKIKKNTYNRTYLICNYWHCKRHIH